jgi:hypothetical protein
MRKTYQQTHRFLRHSHPFSTSHEVADGGARLQPRPINGRAANAPLASHARRTGQLPGDPLTASPVPCPPASADAFSTEPLRNDFHFGSRQPLLTAKRLAKPRLPIVFDQATVAPVSGMLIGQKHGFCLANKLAWVIFGGSLILTRVFEDRSRKKIAAKVILTKRRYNSLRQGGNCNAFFRWPLVGVRTLLPHIGLRIFPNSGPS